MNLKKTTIDYIQDQMEYNIKGTIQIGLDTYQTKMLIK
jgi:hypothetical protein